MEIKKIGLKPHKEQAKILYNKMYNIIKDKHKSKQCVISSINILLFNDYQLFLPGTKMEQYWKNVIKEINTL